MALKVLLVEDTEESKDLICAALGSSFEVSWAPTLQEALLFLNQENFKLVLLDVVLPDGDGFHFYSMLKTEDKFKDVPVIFLTARDSEADKVMGITLGAEDYIVKPFLPSELRARVEMRIKKRSEQSEKGNLIDKGDIEVNLAEQRAFVKKMNRKEDLGLTPLEFKILVLLATHEEHIFSRDKLLNMVWGENTFLTDRCIDTHIYSLRKKLGSRALWIQSVYGQGYRFSVKSVEDSLARRAA